MSSSSSQQSNQPLLLGLVGGSVILLIVLMMFSGNGRAQQENPALVEQTVNVLPVKYQNTFAKRYRAMGRVESTSQAMVGFERAGRVADVLVEDGQRVNRGDLLARLDTKRIDAQLLEARAALELAVAEARLASISEKRVVALVRSKLESPQRLDEAKEANNIAQARLAQIQAQLDTLTLELEKSTILAPYTADIVARVVDAGAVVNIGQPIFEIANNTTLSARIALPPEVAGTLQIGEWYDLRIGEAAVRGQLLTIGSQRNLRTRTVETVFSVNANANAVTLVGDLIAVDLAIELNQFGVWVPISALANGVRGMWNVYVVSNEGATQVATRAVEIIYSDGERAFITGALQDGDLLVIGGTHRFVARQNVNARVSDIAPNITQ